MGGRRLARVRVRRSGYVLLETVLATGLLIMGLAVIGGMVQDSDTVVYKMHGQVRARMMAELFLSRLDSGLVELNSADEEQDEEFGPRYPRYGWRLTTEETTVDDLFLLTLDVFFDPTRTEGGSEDYDFDEAELVYTLRTFRAAPQKLDLAEAFGLREEEMEELAEKLLALGIPGLDPAEFDMAILAKLDFEELIEVLPTVLDAFGVDFSQLLAQLPPEVREALDASGLLDGVGAEGAGLEALEGLLP